MKTNSASFDKDKDLQEVDQFGYIDLVKSFQNGYVAGDVESVAENYNDIEDPSSIVGKPRDCFEAMRMQDVIVQNVKKGTSSVEPAPAKVSTSKVEN